MSLLAVNEPVGGVLEHALEMTRDTWHRLGAGVHER